jgi:hypothetical protein
VRFRAIRAGERLFIQAHRCGREQGRDVRFKGGAVGGRRGVAVTPEETAAQRVTAVLAERDAVQANLLELDGSFAKQVLEGAALTGQTRDRWASASAALATLWETFLAYSAVVDRIAALGTGNRRPARKDLPELVALLTEGCVQLPGASVPLARRDLAASGRPPVTLAAAVGAMRRAFAEVTELTSVVEAVWAAVAVPLDAATEELARVRPLVGGLGADIEAEFRGADDALRALRAAANADPLALWRPSSGGGGQGGSTDTAAAGRLREQAAALAGRIAEVDRLRQQARRRIDDLAAGVAAARTARQDAVAARRDAATRISALPPLPPEITEPPLASLGGLAAGGQWSRLAAELAWCEAELARSATQTADLRAADAGAIDKRDELRGLLRAYKAKAARLGAAEDPDLAARHDKAHGLLWTAPCDLAAAEAAVAAYQRAILGGERRR